MSYKVIHAFTDSQDFNHIYRVGDVYPRSGMRVAETRLKELASVKNKRKTPLIAPDKDVFLSYMNPPEKTKYTKTEINRMSTSELKTFAMEHGVDNAEEMTGSELKKILIEKFGL